MNCHRTATDHSAMQTNLAAVQHHSST